MQDKRVFISGGAGVIGTALVNLLLKEGADIFVGDLKPCPKDWLSKVKYRKGDLNTITQQELLDFNPEVFFHLAATFERSEESFPFLEENFHHNVQLSHHLMSCLKDSSVLKKVVFASSYLNYDPTLYLFSEKPQTPTLLTENSTINPRNVCGAAKFFHEQELRLLESFIGNQTSIVSARIFRVYGRGSRDVISRWVRAGLHQEPLKVYCSEGMFDYIFADDVAEGLFRLAKSTFSGVVNLGSGKARSVQEVVDVIRLYFPTVKIEKIDSDIPFEASQADMQLFHQITGWRPTQTLETAIPLVINYERDQLKETSLKSDHFGVLVTSISKKIPLLQAVSKAIEKIDEHCGPLYGSDSDVNCIGKYAVDHFWHSPQISKTQIATILDYCAQSKIKAVIPTRNADLEFYSKHLVDLNKNGIHVMVSDPKTISNCLDKLQFATVLHEHHFPVIPTAKDIKEIKSKSLVVKEQFGAGSSRLALNLSREEAVEFAKQLENPIFQPFIEGVEWSVDLYRSKKGRVMGCVARQRDLVVRGESQVTTTVSFPELENLCTELANCLNINGHAVIQVIVDEEGDLHVIECNPRFGGASTASLAVGLDTFYWFLLECSGANLQDYFFDRKADIRQVRYPADWIFPWSSSLI